MTLTLEAIWNIDNELAGSLFILPAHMDASKSYEDRLRSLLVSLADEGVNDQTLLSRCFKIRYLCGSLLNIKIPFIEIPDLPPKRDAVLFLVNSSAVDFNMTNLWSIVFTAVSIEKIVS